LKLYGEAPAEQKNELSFGRYDAIKRMSTNAGPDLSHGKPLDRLVDLKTTYEFAALLFGPPVFANNPALHEIHRTLRAQETSSKIFSMEPLMAD
jgi:hypothetical protein